MALVDVQMARTILTRLQPFAAPLAGRSALYAAAMAVVVSVPRIGDAGAALGLAVVLALAAAFVPARDLRDRMVLLALALAGGTALLIIEWICVWRGQWAYPGNSAAPVVAKLNAAAARLWACFPQGLTDSILELPLIGQASVPLWIWPCRVLVILAAYDVLRTTDTLLSVGTGVSANDVFLDGQ